MTAIEELTRIVQDLVERVEALEGRVPAPGNPVLERTLALERAKLKAAMTKYREEGR